MAAGSDHNDEDAAPPLLDVACLLAGAFAVLVAWVADGLRLTIPLAGLWLVAEAAVPGRGRPGGDGVVHRGRSLRRVVDLAGYGGLFAASVLLVSGGIDEAGARPLVGTALAATGVALGLLVAALLTSLVRSGRRRPP